MSTQELYLEREEIPRLQITGELDETNKMYSWNHAPHLAIYSPGAEALVLMPSLPLLAFNPSALPSLEAMVQGDLIQLFADPDNEVYKLWNPPEEFQYQAGHVNTMRVKIREKDVLDYPVAVWEAAL